MTNNTDAATLLALAEPAKRPGILAMGERFLSSEWTGLLAFGLLLSALHFTTWQAFLAIIVFVQRTTKRPAWLLREKARARAQVLS